jgi:hypothetical protein
MPRIICTKGALGLALLLIAAPTAAQAASAPSHVPVPAGRVQHTVTDTLYPAATNTVHHPTVRLEEWNGARAARLLETNVATHKVKSDCDFTAHAMSHCWVPRDAFFPTAPEAGVIHLNPTGPYPLPSWIDAGAQEKSQIGQPATGMHVTGTTTYLGHAALMVATDPHPTSEGGTVSNKMIVDARTYYPLWQEDTIVGQPYTTPDGTKGIQNFDRIIKVTKMDLLSAHGVRLKISPHPGAKIVNDAQRLAHRNQTHARKTAATR